MTATLAVAGVLFGAVPASAATVTTTGCGSTVAAHVGDRLAMSGRSFGNIVYAVAQEPQNKNTAFPADPDKLRDQMNVIPSIPVGFAANAASTTVPGDSIAPAVVHVLNQMTDGFGGTILGIGNEKSSITHDVQLQLTTNCVLNARAVNFRTAPPRPPAQPSHPAPQAPSAGPVLTPQQSAQAQQQASEEANQLQSMLTPGRAPMRDYSGLPAGVPGAYAPPPAARYGTPGSSPMDGQFTGGFGQGAPNGTVRSAGQAKAIGANRNGSPIELPMLLAVIAVAGVGAGLVRTWVLRRTG